MGLIDLFNKWIVERGSAVVQEKHLSMFRDQLVLADKRIIEVGRERDNLFAKTEEQQAEIQVLKVSIEKSNIHIKKLEKDINVLRKKIYEYEHPHKIFLENEQIKILKSLFNAEKLSVGEIAKLLNIGIQVANYHLEELKKLKMVKPVRIWCEKNIVIY